ncbi:MAG: acyl-CoA synthetase, partial [Methanomicrobium sp.]|nr:acyl-CoA synthetase [Methanomicrobium sp.]
LDMARHTIIVNSDAVVAIGGGAGTLSEIAFAWQLYRLIIGYRIGGWSGKLADTRIDWRVRYPDIPDDRVYGVDSVDEVTEHLNRLLPLYNIRHKSIL